MTNPWPWLTPRAWLVALLFMVVGDAALAGRGASIAASGPGSHDTVVWKAPPVDVAKLMREDGERLARPDGLARIGLPMSTALTPADSGSRIALSGGETQWRLVVRSEGALWLILGFDRFEPGPGARLWVSSADGSSRRGPFTRDEAIEGRLWVPPIDGDTAIVELEWPGDPSRGAGDVRLATVSHGYRPWAGGNVGNDPAGGVAAECEVDVNCDLGDNWQDEKRGVVRIVIEGGLAICSGSLVNNTALDCAGYVYTADHCFANPQLPDIDFASLMFVFNYEQPACEPGNVPIVHTLTGAQDIARYPPADARLLRLIPAIPPSFGVYFNGWNRSTSGSVAQSYAIHHPVGAVKKISFNDDVLASSPAYTAGTHWRVNDWEQGVTEGGSSGGPLFDPSGRIVGELHSGTSTCDGGTAGEFDDFGRFSSAWTGTGQASNSLRPHLDPVGTGAVGFAGMDSSFCGQIGPRLVHSSHECDDGQGNENGVPEPGDVAKVSMRLANQGPRATTGGIGADLFTTDPDVRIHVEHAAFPNLGAGQSAQSQAPGFTIDVDPDRDCGRSIPFEVEASSNEGSWTTSFRLYTGEEVGTLTPFDEDMEPPGPSGWNTQVLLGSAQWVLQSELSNSPVTSWHIPNAVALQDTVLRSPVLDVPARATLRFMHALSSGIGDGGVLEYSTDGTTWLDAKPLITSGQYNSLLAPAPTSTSTLAGRFLWTGGDISAWRTVEVDLSSLEGSALRLRWRFATDASGSGLGWLVDDVEIEAPEFECAAPHDRRLPGALCRGHRPGSQFGDCPSRRVGPSR